MGATSDPRLYVFPSNHLKYLQVGSSSYKQNQIKVIHKANKTRKPTKLENKKNLKTNCYSPHHNSSIHKTLSQNCSRSKQFVVDNGQQNMNGDWNISNNLKKTCLDFTLAIGVKREMRLGIFRDFEVERGRELVLFFGGFICVIILAYIVKGIFQRNDRGG